jgi:hypothetical protein
VTARHFPVVKKTSMVDACFCGDVTADTAPFGLDQSMQSMPVTAVRLYTCTMNQKNHAHLQGQWPPLQEDVSAVVRPNNRGAGRRNGGADDPSDRSHQGRDDLQTPTDDRHKRPPDQVL